MRPAAAFSRPHNSRLCAFPPVIATTDKEIEYLVRRFTLEKGFAVAGDLDANDHPVASGVDPSRFGYDLPVIYVPEIEPLKEHFDAVLVRADGINFTALGIRKYDGRGIAETLSRDHLIEIGEACLRYTGKSSGAKMPVFLNVLEVHPNEPRPEAVEQLNTLRHELATDKKKVFVSAYSVGWRSGTVLIRTGRWTVSRGRARYLRRILKATDEPEHRMVERVESAGLNLSLVLVGALAGVALALAFRFLLATLGAESGQLYGLADYLGGFTSVGIAVFARRIRAASAVQAVLAAVCYSLLFYGGLVFAFGAPFSFWMVLNTLVFTLTGFYIGAESEMA